LLYLAYNDYEMAEGLLSNAVNIEPAHLLARMHLDVVLSLRRAAAAMVPSSLPYMQASPAPGQPGWPQVSDGPQPQVCSQACGVSCAD